MVDALSRDLTVEKAVDAYKWKIVAQSEDLINPPNDYRNIGLVDFNFDCFNEENLDIDSDREYEYPFGSLLKKLWPGDLDEQLEKMNTWIKAENLKARSAKDVGEQSNVRK